MVRVHEHVPGAMLLERLDPGTPLAPIALNGGDDEATEIISEVIARISNPHTELYAFTSIEDWARGFDHYLAGGDRQLPRALVEEARQVFVDLCASQRRPRLLHGDLQHYNVLFDDSRGWLAIDPKGVVGEVEYELGASLRNPGERPDLFASPAIVERRVGVHAARLGIDADRTLRWAYAQAVLSAIWSVEDGFPVDSAHPSLQLARAIEPLLG